jgi:O-antigen ligase
MIVAAILVWLRWPRLRMSILVFTVLLILTGVLTQTLWDFGGGDTEWSTSGGSRIALAERVLQVSWSNPITGLGPAAYRSYAAMAPLQYGRALWVDPSINSHNNYIDIFSQTGLIGLGLFLWFMVAVLMMALRLAHRYQSGFIAGYVNGMIAAWAAIMVVMMLLDWFLPFVYNVGFPGFQASVLLWLFFGGLVAVESWGDKEGEEPEQFNP